MSDATLVTADDGLPAREVGAWVDRKGLYVDRYAQLFATGMKNKWSQRAYVELFAGPGRSRNRTTGDFIEGSAVRALSASFTDYVFVDLDPRSTAALEERAHRLGHSPTVIQGDCNRAIDRVIASIPPRALTLAFVDPTNWQVRSARRAVEDRFLVPPTTSYPMGSMRRLNRRAVGSSARASSRRRLPRE